MERETKGAKKERNVKGVKIRTMSYIMILIAFVIYIFVIYATFQTMGKYRAMTQATEDYINCEKAAADLYQGSAVLTEQVRMYVITAEPSYAEAYFEEANVTRRRERAIESLGEYHAERDVKEFLEAALRYSNKLMEREIYAMKLVTLANGYDESNFAERLKNCQISAQDMALSGEAKLQKAEDMVFDTGYRNAKELIENNVSYALDSIMSYTKNGQVQSMETLRVQLSRIRIYISLLFIMNVIIFFAITVLIVKPLRIYIKCINDNRALEVVGAYEFKYLALTYNDIYELNSANEIMLRKKAEHDALTGILNRGAFDQIRAALRTASFPVALMLIDVDEFKTINDQYGHDVGDRALKRVANLLTRRFRSTDYVARVGGDEFAVILTEATEENMSAVADKLEKLNEQLKSGDDDMPPLSLSVGVAMSRQGFDDTLYKKADMALYHVKDAGRNGYCFYQDVGSFITSDK